MKILTVVGARPQFVKASTVSSRVKEIASSGVDINEVIVHTGQHFDDNMSDVFFRQLDIPRPRYNLGINCLDHGAMTGRMIEGIEQALAIERPDYMLIYGDTNSTLAGAIAASKMGVKIAHVEAGLRSYNMGMPEEVNRILADRVSKLLFCPTKDASNNLSKEGYKYFDCGIYLAGDVMLDAAMRYKGFSKKPDFDIPGKFMLATIHRADNVKNISRLYSIMSAVNIASKKINVIMPLHPATAKALLSTGFKFSPGVLATKPLDYLEMLHVLQKCNIVLTDSGGLQKEAYFFEKPCIVARDETEWVELARYGYSVLAGADQESIIESIRKFTNKPVYNDGIFGNGDASIKIIDAIINDFYN